MTIDEENMPKVVYHYNPTSNRNDQGSLDVSPELYIIIILHQTATLGMNASEVIELYIIIILHQTATSTKRSRGM